MLDSRFERNLGVLTETQQRRLSDARVLIVGTGGIGGTEALCLARTGVGRFTLVDFDAFEPTNANRQMACTDATLGRNKSEVTAELLRSINPRAEIEVIPRKVALDEVGSLVRGHDLVFPAADDFAYSILVFRAARTLGVPAVLAVPSGLWAMVSVLPPDGPRLEALLGLPRDLEYAELRPLFGDRFYRLASFFYVVAGKWRKEYQHRFVEEGAPLAQLCPVVWMAGSAAALEAVKWLTDVAPPVVAPRFWWMDARGARVERLPGPNLHTAMVAHRRLSYGLLKGPLGPRVKELVLRSWERKR